MKSKGNKSKSYTKGHTSGNEITLPARPVNMDPSATDAGRAIRKNTPQEPALRKNKKGM